MHLVTKPATPVDDPRLLRLHPGDNVLIVTRSLPAGDTVLKNDLDSLPAPKGRITSARSEAKRNPRYPVNNDIKP